MLKHDYISMKVTDALMLLLGVGFYLAATIMVMNSMAEIYNRVLVYV